MNKRKISAEIIADSKNEFGQRITSFVVTFPRIILAEFNTHRMFSRNSASSRAIPFEKMLKMVEEDPFIPIAWQKDHKGMQGTEYMNDQEKQQGRVFYGPTNEIFMRDVDNTPAELWLEARDKAVATTRAFSAINTTKQLCNRLLEPFMWHTVIVTATDWENFFALRCPKYKMINSYGTHYFRSKKDYLKNVGLPDEISNYKNFTEVDWLKLNTGQAEIHAMALAEAMWNAFNESTPKELTAGKWHIPFGDNIVLPEHLKNWEGKMTDYLKEITDSMIKVATARCARVSYLNFEGKDDYNADAKLHDVLLAAGHMSPFEHCARAMSTEEYYNHVSGIVNCTNNQLTDNDQIQQISLINKESFGWSGNFQGFVQYRKTIPGENIK